MNFKDFLDNGSIKPFKPVGTQIEDLLKSAEKDIEASTNLIDLNHYGLSRDTAYEAMLKMGMALMFSYGFRPESGSHHATTVRFTERVFGPKHDSLIASFDRFRRTRHERLYRGRETATRSQAEKPLLQQENFKRLSRPNFIDKQSMI